MQPLINKIYKPTGIATTTFEPVHSKGLSNEFFCYANFECEAWKWRVQGAQGCDEEKEKGADEKVENAGDGSVEK